MTRLSDEELDAILAELREMREQRDALDEAFNKELRWRIDSEREAGQLRALLREAGDVLANTSVYNDRRTELLPRIRQTLGRDHDR